MLFAASTCSQKQLHIRSTIGWTWTTIGTLSIRLDELARRTYTQTMWWNIVMYSEMHPSTVSPIEQPILTVILHLLPTILLPTVWRNPLNHSAQILSNPNPVHCIPNSNRSSLRYGVVVLRRCCQCTDKPITLASDTTVRRILDMYSARLDNGYIQAENIENAPKRMPTVPTAVHSMHDRGRRRVLRWQRNL